MTMSKLHGWVNLGKDGGAKFTDGYTRKKDEVKVARMGTLEKMTEQSCTDGTLEKNDGGQIARMGTPEKTGDSPNY